MKRFRDVLIDQQGNVRTLVAVEVRLKGTTTKAVLYGTDNVGGGTIGNPITSDGTDGTIWFYAPDGTYDLCVAPGAAGSFTIPDVEIYDFDQLRSGLLNDYASSVTFTAEQAAAAAVALVAATLDAKVQVATDAATAAVNAKNDPSVVAVGSDILAGGASKIAIVAGDLALGGASKLGIVSTNIANINTAAGSIANINLVGGSIANVSLVGGSIANVNAVATDMALGGALSFILRTPQAAIDAVAAAAAAAASTAIASLRGQAKLRGANQQATKNLFDLGAATTNAGISPTTGAVIMCYPGMATGFIPANSGGTMVIGADIPATVAVTVPLSTSANLMATTGFQTDTLVRSDTGASGTFAGYKTTPKFPVTPGATYTTNMQVLNVTWCLSFWDAAGNWVSGQIFTGVVVSGGNITSQSTFTIPTDARIRSCSFGLGANPTNPYVAPQQACQKPTVIAGATISQCVDYVAGSSTPANGIAKYDINYNFLRGTAGPIAAGTAITIEDDVAFIRAGFATDVSATLMVVNGSVLPSAYGAFGSYPPNVIDAKIADLTKVWSVMAGLDFWFPLTEGAGTTAADASGNGKVGTLGGSTTTPAAWLSPVGIQLGSQTMSFANCNGRRCYGFVANFPVGSVNPFFGGAAISGFNSVVFGQDYGSDVHHGAQAFFPGLARTGGSSTSRGNDGFSGIHAVSFILGDGSAIKDVILVDGVEVDYFVQGNGDANLTNVAHLLNAIALSNGTFYSAWGQLTRPSKAREAARHKSEMARLRTLGVSFPTDQKRAVYSSVSSCVITGTSLDQGFGASQTPSSLLNITDFPLTIYNLAISGQGPKEMDAGYDGRERPLFNPRGARNISFHGGVTNGLINFLQDPDDALLDVLSHNRKAQAQGNATIATTMTSRSGATGFAGLTGDVLAQQYNAKLLARGDAFNWVCHYAAVPQLGATGASANTTYYGDGTHWTNAGQLLAVACQRAAIRGVYPNPLTIVSGNYTHDDPDRQILQTSGSNSVLTLKNANYMSFNSQGILTIVNTGAGTMTVNPVASQTINGQASVTVAPGASLRIRPAVLNPAAGGAVWVLA